MSSDRLKTFADITALHYAAAQEIIRIAASSVAQRGICRLVLAGGSTPRGVYRLLGAAEFRSQMQWDKLELYWGDERCVPPDHAASNYRMVHDALISAVPVPSAAIHRIRGELEPGQAAEMYEQELIHAQQDGTAMFDLVLLGLGTDGHTASLFPGTPDLGQSDRLVVTTKSPVPPVDRVSLSLRALNDSHSTRFLVATQEKAGALARVLASGAARVERPPPAALIKPSSGDLQWLVDRAAASALPAAF